MEKKLLVRVSLVEFEQYQAAKPLYFDDFTLDDVKKVSELESAGFDVDVREFLLALCDLVDFAETKVIRLWEE